MLTETMKERGSRWSEQPVEILCVLFGMMNKQATILESEPEVQVLIILSWAQLEVREWRLIYSLSQLVLTRHK